MKFRASCPKGHDNTAEGSRYPKGRCKACTRAYSVVREQTRQYVKCEHGSRHTLCRDCCGASICGHGRLRRFCCLCKPTGSYSGYVRRDKSKYGSLPENFMTYEEYFNLIQQPCFFCGRTPEQCNGMGVDRIDNTLGHVSGNLQPCCGEHNIFRGAMTVENFIASCILVANNFNKPQNHTLSQ